MEKVAPSLFHFHLALTVNKRSSNKNEVFMFAPTTTQTNRIRAFEHPDSGKEKDPKRSDPLNKAGRLIQDKVNQAFEKLMLAESRHEEIGSEETRIAEEHARQRFTFWQTRLEQHEKAKVERELEVRKLFNTVQKGHIAKKRSEPKIST